MPPLRLSFVSNLGPFTEARDAPCPYGGGAPSSTASGTEVAATQAKVGTTKTGTGCQCCPEHARCPGGYRAWPMRGYWAKHESTRQTTVCKEPSRERCVGMVHGSLPTVEQCGVGYRGVACGRCAMNYYEDSTTKACLSCGGTNRGVGEAEDAFVWDDIEPFLWLLLGLCLGEKREAERRTCPSSPVLRAVCGLLCVAYEYMFGFSFFSFISLFLSVFVPS